MPQSFQRPSGRFTASSIRITGAGKIPKLQNLMMLVELEAGAKVERVSPKSAGLYRESIPISGGGVCCCIREDSSSKYGNPYAAVMRSLRHSSWKVPFSRTFKKETGKGVSSRIQ